ncbi:proton-conducting transporter membrane subunit [Aquirufa sp. HETE-83D]|uniref:Proton-conducting transporter membrane subunit n=1 Tax=Aquirufa esocilacus TaxID=3096513 RepID=A0ABW6DES8_9BACT
MSSFANLTQLAERIQSITAGLHLAIPELIVAGTILFSLFIELFLHVKTEKFSTSWRYFTCQIPLLLALSLSFQRNELGLVGSFASGLFEANLGSNAINTLILGIGFLLILMNQIHKKSFTFEELIGFLSILLGALLSSLSTNALSLFLSIEFMSMGTYVLVSLRKESSRASLPYVLFGLGSSALFIYGISLLYGLTGTLDFTSVDFSRGISVADPYLRGFALGLFAVGLLFKMSWAPFHPWNPDVMEKLPAPWMTWISTAPKLAIAFVGVRLLPALPVSYANELAVLAILTLLVGNLGALGQNNTKRLLAYSSIAHGGFLAMAWFFQPVQALDAILFYGFLYSIASLLVFYLIDEADADDVKSFAGLGSEKPVPAFFLLTGLVALVGLPPAGTFIAKMTYFSLLWSNYETSTALGLLLLLLVAILVTAISLFYYLKIPFQLYFKKSTKKTGLWNKLSSLEIYSYGFLTAILIASLLFPAILTNLWK